MEQTVNNNVDPSYIIVISVVINENYCKCTLFLYNLLSSYLYVHCILDNEYILQ